MKIRMVTLFLLLFASILLNGGLLYALKKYYAQSRLTAVFPTHESFYRQANLKLPPKTQKRIVLFGDSRIQEWKDLPNIANVEFINRGIGGETTAQLRARLETDVLKLNPDVVILQMGINDLVTLGVANEVEQKAIIQQCDENLKLVVEALTQAHIQVILLTIIPPAQPHLLRLMVWSALIAQQVEEINQSWLKRAATQTNQFLHLIDTAATLKNQQGQWHSNVNRDTLHLTATGYDHLNQAVLSILQPH